MAIGSRDYSFLKTSAPTTVRVMRLILVLILSAGASPAASAADAAAAGLDSLLTIAFRENQRIRSLEAAYRAGLEKVPQAGALPDPMLNYIAESTPFKRPSPTQAATTRIGVSQMIMFPGKLGLMKSAMAEDAEMAREQLERARLEVAADLTKAYYDLYLLRASADVIEENQANLRAMAEVARTKYEVGTAMQQDLLKANVELARETNQLVILRAKIPAAAARINAILNRASGAPLGRPSLGDTASVWPDLAILQDEAAARQPMLLMKDRAIRRNEYALRLARKKGLPDFTVGVEYMAEKEMPDTWTGMVGLSLPIWRWNKVAPARREAEQSLASAQADRNQTKNDVLFMVRDAWTMASTTRTLVNLYRDSVLPQAEQSLASTRAAYETNRVDFLNLLDSQRSLLMARLEYEEAITDYLKSRADLGLAVGDAQLLGANHE